MPQVARDVSHRLVKIVDVNHDNNRILTKDHRGGNYHINSQYMPPWVTLDNVKVGQWWYIIKFDGSWFLLLVQRDTLSEEI